MNKCNDENIKGEVIGEMNECIRRVYANNLARILIKQYDKETCKKILEELKTYV
jgi:hypothetical protein